MAKVRVKITRAQRAKLLKSAAVQNDLEGRANRIRDAAGGTERGYMSSADVHAKRVRASAFTSNAEAIRHNAETNALVKALDAGR